MFDDPEFRNAFAKGMVELVQEQIVVPLKKEIAELRSVEVLHRDHIERLEKRIVELEARDQQAKKLRVVNDG